MKTYQVTVNIDLDDDTIKKDCYFDWNEALKKSNTDIVKVISVTPKKKVKRYTKRWFNISKEGLISNAYKNEEDAKQFTNGVAATQEVTFEYEVIE